ncbi:MAG: glycosyl hydrolase repeat-containing glycosyl hydrolase [Gemmatimonadetes bacterium]|nr:glycosyl hydrolase repeat-containing glycosyl hydrolase [Gemmatimonadota bacterium]
MAPDTSTVPADGGTVLLVGTMKGAFVVSSDAERKEWHVGEPHFRGETVYSLAFDQRGGRRRMLAGTQSFHWGSVVRTSDDFGATWTSPERQNVRFPEDSGLALKNIWQIRPGPSTDPDLLYCGVEPAALFESRDAGDTWSPVEGLLNHEQRPRWVPGGGGLCMHTIVLDEADPQRMGVAISTAGFYRTDDGGQSWQPRNQGVRAQFLPDKYPEFGQCVHKVVNHPSRPERLYLQNHWGLYRSDDWGDTWHDIANGVPSDFGFAMQVHPHEPDTVYIVPLESDEFRVVPEAKLRVFRTRDAGGSWEPLGEGLPQHDAYETVLRDAMSADGHPSAGLYFGTRSGKLFGSSNAGDTWMEISDALPPIVCVRAAVVGSA